MLLDDEKITGLPLYLVMLGMMIAGSTNTILTKSQNGIISENYEYKHPFCQCFMMFMGEFCCLGAYGIKLFIHKRRFDKMSQSEQ